MTKTCPGCGATAPADARYCRHCGTALRSTGSNVGAETISPLANTEPLDQPLFDTGELNAKEPQPNNAPAADTFASTLAMPPRGLADDDNVGTSGEITIPVVRNTRAEQTTTASAPDAVAAAQADGASTTTADAATATAQASVDVPASVGAPIQVGPAPALRTTERRASRVWLVIGVSTGALLLLCVVGAGVWFVLHRRSATVAPNTNTNAPVTPAPDAQQQAQAKVAEAQGLLSAGDTVGATARLREAVALDPANADAHRQLA